MDRLIDLDYERLTRFVGSLDPAEPERGNLDLKAEIPTDVVKLARSLASFANAGGGHVIYGVLEKKSEGVIEIVDVDLASRKDKPSEWISNVIRRHTEPPIGVEVSVRENPSKTNHGLVVVEITESRLKPVQTTQDKKFPVRTSTGTADATRSQLIDMIYATRAREELLEAKLQRRRLFDPQADDFCLNGNARRLGAIHGLDRLPHEVAKFKRLVTAARPVICFAVTPTIPLQLRRWTRTEFAAYDAIARRMQTWSILPNRAFTVGSEQRISPKGIVSTGHRVDRSVFEVDREGHCEVATVAPFFAFPEEHTETPVFGTSLAAVCTYAASLAATHATFLREVYDFREELLLTVALRGVGHSVMTGWSAPGQALWYRGRPRPFTEEHLRFAYRYSSETLADDESAMSLIGDITQDVAAVFGREEALAHFAPFPRGLLQVDPPGKPFW